MWQGSSAKSGCEAAVMMDRPDCLGKTPRTYGAGLLGYEYIFLIGNQIRNNGMDRTTGQQDNRETGRLALSFVLPERPQR